MKKGWQIFWHTLFWVGMMAFFIFITHSNSKMSTQALLVIFVVFGLVNISLFYINYLFLIPKYLNRKKYLQYNLMIVLAILVFGFLKYGLANIYHNIVLVREKGMGNVTFWSYYLSTIFTSLIFVFLSTVLKFTLDWFLNERIQRDLENQRLSAELAFLKSQINPHFLFNSLNTIYSLAYQKSDTTPEAILKLSEIMRYMLYECNDNKVALTKELQYLQNYIDLQLIRFGNKAFVDFKITGNIADQKIVPLLLISFIENAFKHGVANDPENPIIIEIYVQTDLLLFKTENKKHQFNKDALGGIGLINVKRRLDLLYPGQYTININDTKDAYTCELSLYL
jgi:two-component system LytT family sensor kinase